MLVSRRGAIASKESLKELHEYGLALWLRGKTRSSSQFLFAHGTLVIKIHLREIDLKRIVEAVKVKELSDQLSTDYTRCALHYLLCLGVLPVET